MTASRGIPPIQLIRRVFQKFGSRLIKRTFAGRFKDSGIDEIGKDGIDVTFESMLVPEIVACFIKLKAIVKSLRKKISATVEGLVVIIQLLIGMKRNLNGLCLLFLFIFKGFYPGFFSGPIHDIIPNGAMLN